jgi:biopolymer transport protein ExbB/TolQ
VGLLGTVFGMLVTFQALASGGGGKVTEAMAAGISQALFPPEVGLCIALPGLILLQFIKRRRVELEVFLARLESYAVQWHRSKQGFPFIQQADDSYNPFATPKAVEQSDDRGFVARSPHPA